MCAPITDRPGQSSSFSPTGRRFYPPAPRRSPMATAGGADYGAGVTAGELQTLRVAASLGAVAVAMLLQRVSPHARLRGSWRVHGGLSVADVLVMGPVCGACAFTTAEWAARGG